MSQEKVRTRLYRRDQRVSGNVGFRSVDASVSIDLIPFIQGDRIVRGGRFIVHVDHGGYRSR